MAFMTAVTLTVGFETSHGGRAFLGEGQSLEVFRLGTVRKHKRSVPFRVRALLAPLTMKFKDFTDPEDHIRFTCAPNDAGIDDVTPQRIAEAARLGAHESLGESSVYRSVMLSDPGCLITIHSGKTPGLLAIDSDPGTPFYMREGVSLDTYHRLLYRDMEAGPRYRMVDRLELPSFWMKDQTGSYVTLNMHTMEEERVSPLRLPCALMKCDEFMDPKDGLAWATQVHEHLTETLPRPKLDVIFGYASPGTFSGKKVLQKVDDLGTMGCRPVTQLVATEAPYLPSVLRASNMEARSQISTGYSLEPSLA